MSDVQNVDNTNLLWEMATRSIDCQMNIARLMIVMMTCGNDDTNRGASLTEWKHFTGNVEPFPRTFMSTCMGSSVQEYLEQEFG